MLRAGTAAVLVALVLPGIAAAQQASRPITIVVGQEPTTPIPTLIGGLTVNLDVADQLFLRLATPPVRLTTAGDKGFQPQLARRWTRRDSLTIAFDLDPRARWHDGVPVTARDVVFAFTRARNPALNRQLASLLQPVADVRAEGERTVVVRFSRAYPEQLYDATFHVAPLPAHLLSGVPAESLATSAYAKAPIGNGPFRWVKRTPGESIELARVPDFWLGPVGPSGVLVRAVTDPAARLNLVLSGESDAYEATVPPAENRARVEASGVARTIAVPTLSLLYLNFNQRNAEKSGPHPILGDVRVRRALVHALDRSAYATALFAGFADVPVGPASQLLWPREAGARPSAPHDPAAARRLLAEAGWRDSDGDGILDRGGQPLTLRLIAPSSSFVRRQVVQIAEQQWAAVGVQAKIELLEPPVFFQRRTAGAFDVSAESVTQDPSPAGLVQTWTCQGGTNVSGFCDPQTDSLIAAARFDRSAKPTIWRKALRRIDDLAPAAFLASPSSVLSIHRRVTSPVITPWSLWSAVWQWKVAR
jgi:peptide/nickel transport system substrate-binding protein